MTKKDKPTHSETDEVLLLKSIFESSTDSIIANDLEGNILAWNEGAVLMYGYKSSEILGKNASILYTPEDIKSGKAQAILDEVRQIGKWDGEIQHVRKDCSQLTAIVTITLRKDPNNIPIGFTLISRDLDELQQIKRIFGELKELKQFTHNLTETNVEAIITTDLSGVITDVNYLMCQMTEFTRNELIGSPFKEYFTDHKRAQDTINKTIAEGKITNCEIMMRSRTLQEKIISFNAAILYSATEKPKGILFVGRDITTQKYLEEELRAKNEKLEDQNHLVQETSRLKSEFLANMSHELRTPLNVIIGFAKLMHKGIVGPISDEHKEYLDDILTNSNQLLQLINDVLDLSKIEAGKMDFHYELVDVKKFMKEIQDNFIAMVVKKSIHLKIDISPTFEKVILDRTKFKQIIYNYVSNAIKFTSDGGQVTIRLSDKDKHTFCLEVEDNGIGIRKEDLSRLFIEFQQLDSSLTKESPGTGLGLALTRHIVEAQGGKVGVTSTPGKGSIFYAILPCFPQDNTIKNIKKAPGGQAALSTVPKVLVIENESQGRLVLVDSLTDAGCDIEIAENLLEAVRCSYTHKFDAIIVDMLLPDMKNWSILRTLRTSNTDLRTPALITTIVTEKTVDFCCRIHDFLIKPVVSAELLSALQWSGAPPYKNKSILIVDSDAKALNRSKGILQKFGYLVTCENNAKNGMTTVKQVHPDVVILDPLMLETNGFDFLYTLRKSKIGQYTPVIILTRKNLSKDERGQLKSYVQRIVIKGESSIKTLIDEFQPILSSSNKTQAKEEV